MAEWTVEFPLWRRLLKWTDRARISIEGVTSLQGPLEDVNGELVLRIPLAAGGSKLARCTRSISRVDGGVLIVFIPRPLAEQLGMKDGSLVGVDNRKGNFNVTLLEQ